MKKIIFFLSILFIMLPVNAFAISFSCDKDMVKENEDLSCTVLASSNDYIETFEGYIEVNPNVKCQIDKANSLKLSSYEDGYFVFYGTPRNKKIVTFMCRVIKRPVTPIEDSFKVSYVYEDKNGNLEMNGLLTKYTISNIENNVPSEPVTEPIVDKTEPITQTPITEPITEQPTTTTKVNNLLNEEDLMLKNIKIKEVNFNFSRYNYNYDIEIPNNIEVADISVEVANMKSTYEILGSTNLNVGDNQIIIRVHNESLSASKDYVLNLKRLEFGIQNYNIDDDSSLSSLIISNHVFSFDKNITEYDLELDDSEDSIELIANAYGPNASVSISKTDNLKNGSKVLIIVTSYSKKNKTTYTINIHKTEKEVNYSMYFVIASVIVVVIVISYIIQKIHLKRIAKDPILKLKNEKRLINKGLKLDASSIPDTEIPGKPIKLEDKPVQQIVIQTDKVEDTNLNKITDNRAVLDLNSAKIVSNDNKNTTQKTPTYIVSDDEEIEILDD